MKKIFLLLAAAMLLGAGLWSCGKDDDNNNEGTGNTYVDPNPQNPGDDPQPQPQPQPVGDWVDLGLPSGLLWATRNVGATSPEDYGNYYAWGETEPRDYYDWEHYRYGIGYCDELIKYCTNSEYGHEDFVDNLTVLQAGDDAAAANMDDGARTPTKEEWEELFDNTTFIWTSMNGVPGGKFTASNGNTLFMPAAGYHVNDGSYFVSVRGYYWSSSLDAEHPQFAWYSSYSSTFCEMCSGSARCHGFTVRAVRSAQ